MSKINEWNTFKRTWKRLLQIHMNFSIFLKINEIIDIVFGGYANATNDELLAF